MYNNSEFYSFVSSENENFPSLYNLFILLKTSFALSLRFRISVSHIQSPVIKCLSLFNFDVSSI